MPDPIQLDEHGHPIISVYDQWAADPVDDRSVLGSADDKIIAARIRALRTRMITDPGPALDLAVPR